MKKSFTYFFMFSIILGLIGVTQANFGLGVNRAMAASSLDPCQFITTDGVMRLQGNCTLREKLNLSDGQTLEGEGYTMYLGDPASPAPKLLTAIGITEGKVKINNLKIVGGDYTPNFCVLQQVINLTNASLWMTDVEINSPARPACLNSRGQYSIAIRSSNTLTETQVISIDSSSFINTGLRAVDIGGNFQFNISNNLFDGVATSSRGYVEGLYIFEGSSGMIKRNTFKNFRLDSSAGSIFPSAIYAFSSSGLYTNGLQISQNQFVDNDNAIYLVQNQADGSLPSKNTNNKVINNVVTNSVCNRSDQTGVIIAGRNDKLINNTITGIGYDPSSCAGSSRFLTDFDGVTSAALKNQANK